MSSFVTHAPVQVNRVEAAGFVAAAGAVLLFQPREGHAGVRRDLSGLSAAVGPEGAGEHPLPPDDRAGRVGLPAAHLLHRCVIDGAVTGVTFVRITLLWISGHNVGFHFSPR